MLAVFITLATVIMLAGCALIVYSVNDMTWKGTLLNILAMMMVIGGFILALNVPRFIHKDGEVHGSKAAASSYTVDTVYTVKNGVTQDTTYMIHWKGK